MTPRRPARPRFRGFLAVAVATVFVALAAGSGALSTASVDRGVTLGVAAPGDALLGVRAPDAAVPGMGVPPGTATATGDASAPRNATRPRTATPLLVVTNRLSRPVVVTASVRDGPGSPVVRNGSGPGRLAPGASGPVVASVRCGDGAAGGRVAVVVRATAPGVDVRTERRVAVRCRGP